MLEKNLKDKIDTYFMKDAENDKLLFDSLSLIIYQMESEKTDLHILADLLDADTLQKVVSYFNGAKLSIPTREEYQQNLLLAVCFFLKEIKGMSWPAIKKFIDLPEEYQEFLSSISLGKKIIDIKGGMNKKLTSLFNSLDWDEVHAKKFLVERLANEQ